MSTKIGNLNLASGFVGNKALQSIWVGNNKVYEAATYPSFAECTWTQVKAACQAGVCATIWNVGDTKTMVAADGTTYTIRIADMTPGRYAYTDGTRSSNAVFEFVECIIANSTGTWRMNPSNFVTGGWAAMPLKASTLPTLQSVILPTDLQDLLVEVNILSLTKPQTSSGEVGLSANKLFLPAIYEISTGTTQAYLNEVPKGIWQYYNGKSKADIIKYQVGRSDAISYWPRSANNTSNYFLYISSTGSLGSTQTAAYFAIAPCFAF